MAYERGQQKKDQPKDQGVRITLPEMRVINESMFTRDQYDAKAKAQYKVEGALAKNSPEWEKVIDEIFNYAVSVWGQKFVEEKQLDIDGGEIVTGLVDGDKLAQKRADAGKPGDAYAGCWVIRSSTDFNKDGQPAEGGIQVWDEEVKPITVANRSGIYNGMYGHIGANLKSYEAEDRHGIVYGLKFYLVGFQRTRDGEKLASGGDSSSLFKPVGRTAGGDGAVGRRRVRGAV